MTKHDLTVLVEARIHIWHLDAGSQQEETMLPTRGCRLKRGKQMTIARQC